MTHSATSEFTGGCLCGAVRFAGGTAQPDFRACHCSQCRRWSGFYWAGFDTSDLRITAGEALRWYRSSEQAERGFCAICGSSLFWRRIGGGIDVAPGALDAPSGLRLAGHIFVADKGDYYQIADGLPQEMRE